MCTLMYAGLLYKGLVRGALVCSAGEPRRGFCLRSWILFGLRDLGGLFQKLDMLLGLSVTFGRSNGVPMQCEA